MKIDIKHRWTDSVLCSFEAVDFRDAILQAVKSNADLRDADLRGANLGGANLRGANLSDADLRGADLSDANLRDANLGGANLGGANLGGADLSDANLRDANLGGANLGDANLRDADLRGANLRDADLRGANLGDANLRDADLRGANLSQFKTDLLDILIRAPKEIPALRQSILDGKIDGTVYEGACACLVGTIANARGCNYGELGNGIVPNGSRPAEKWFWNIRRGDTPETSQICAITLEWIDEYQSLIELAKA
jgi:hypothetical protein